MMNVVHLQTGDRKNDSQMRFLTMMARKGTPVNGFQVIAPCNIGQDALGEESEKGKKRTRMDEEFFRLMQLIRSHYDQFMLDISLYRVAITHRKEQISELSTILSNAIQIIALLPKSKRPDDWSQQKNALKAQLEALALEQGKLDRFESGLHQTARNAGRDQENDWHEERAALRDRAQGASPILNDLFDEAQPQNFGKKPYDTGKGIDMDELIYH